MKARVIKGWRRFTTDEYTGRERALVFDFAELLKVWR